jgi:hypothetical protein
MEATSRLSVAELEYAPNLSHTTDFKLIRHRLVIEAGYLAQCQGKSISLDKGELSTLAGLGIICDNIGDELQAVIVSMSEKGIARIVDVSIGGIIFSLPIWQLLLQRFLYSAHHCDKLPVLRTSIGKPPNIEDIKVRFAEDSG